MWKETAKRVTFPLPKATTGMSEKRCDHVWGHGALIEVEDKGKDQGSPLKAKGSGIVF